MLIKYKVCTLLLLIIIILNISIVRTELIKVSNHWNNNESRPELAKKASDTR